LAFALRFVYVKEFEMEFKKGVLSGFGILIFTLFAISPQFVSKSYAYNSEEVHEEHLLPSFDDTVALDESRSKSQNTKSNSVYLNEEAARKKKVEQNQKVLNDLYKNIKAKDSGVFNYEKKIN
jgi:hypothetical protein